VEILANVSSVFTASPYAKYSGLNTGRFGRWSNGVTMMRADCVSFAAYWKGYNQRVLEELTEDPGPLWVVLGDSTAQGLGASTPHGGYVGQALEELRRRTGQKWRVLNLSVSGSLIRDVLANQIPKLSQLPVTPQMVTVGVGANDIFYSSPSRLFSDLRTLLEIVPDGTVMMDVPLPSGLYGLLGRVAVPYVTRINRVLHEAAADRNLPVAKVSANFLPPWPGKFGCDSFHPSQDGYRDWTRALLGAVPTGILPAAVPGAALA
jgi:lysophospholipase L1-like esterase